MLNTRSNEPQINWKATMAAASTTVAMELVYIEGGQKEGATIVESSPNPFSKAAAAAQRLENKKKALQQANLFIKEAKEARTAEGSAAEKVTDKSGGRVATQRDARKKIVNWGRIAARGRHRTKDRTRGRRSEGSWQGERGRGRR